MQKLLTFFFSKNIRVYAIFNDYSFNDTLTNNIVSFEQLGPDYQSVIQVDFWLKPLFATMDVSRFRHSGVKWLNIEY